jgi:hypothetical protein
VFRPYSCKKIRQEISVQNRQYISQIQISHPNKKQKNEHQKTAENSAISPDAHPCSPFSSS